ncbi:MAG TPA: hypothetical protein VKV26_25635 [Dehalococcoidia bacterium]|nr:hypothetical protein [Dehalococcoidia bacterium]
MSIFGRFFIQGLRAAQRGQGDERGQGLAEYSLILVLVALVCVAALTLLGGGISSALNNMAGSF